MLGLASGSIGFALKILRTESLPLYEELLASGGARTYVEALAPFGLDPRQKAFWDSGCLRLEQLVDEFEALI